jgi:hypothetical protein
MFYLLMFCLVLVVIVTIRHIWNERGSIGGDGED